MGSRRESRAADATVGHCDDKVLEIDLPRGRYALRFADVTGLARPRVLRSVPGAPSSVLGLADWRGGLLTVLDLAGLLGEERVAGRPWVIRLAPPLDHVAFAIPTLPTVGCGGDGVRLEPAALVDRAIGDDAAERPS